MLNDEQSIEYCGWVQSKPNVGMQDFKPVMAELNSYAQRCLTRYFTGDFAS
jgi:hypothetical protein